MLAEQTCQLVFASPSISYLSFLFVLCTFVRVDNATSDNNRECVCGAPPATLVRQTAEALARALHCCLESHIVTECCATDDLYAVLEEVAFNKRYINCSTLDVCCTQQSVLRSCVLRLRSETKYKVQKDMCSSEETNYQLQKCGTCLAHAERCNCC